MKLLKFYGRTMDAALRHIKREFGRDALIVETREIEADSALVRLHPGSRIEITIAVEEVSSASASAPRSSQRLGHRQCRPAQPPAPAAQRRSRPRVSGRPDPAISDDVLHQMGLLKSQFPLLLTEAPGGARDIRDHKDLLEYRYLLDQGIEPSILAPAFRRWLNWRTDTGEPGSDAAPIFNPRLVMKGRGYREWLWNEWLHKMRAHARMRLKSRRGGRGPAMMGVVGANGVGKTEILAKVASKLRLKDRQKVAVISLDTQRVGAMEQWKRYSKLMDVAFIPIVSQEDIDRCAEYFANFDWIGVDTPGAMEPDESAGRLYGSLLAACPNLRTSLVLDAQHRDQLNRNRIDQMKPFNPDEMIFTKLDQTTDRGGLVNLTMEEPWYIEGASTGRRVPEDLVKATPRNLWNWVFEPFGSWPGAVDFAEAPESVRPVRRAPKSSQRTGRADERPNERPAAKIFGGTQVRRNLIGSSTRGSSATASLPRIDDDRARRLVVRARRDDRADRSPAGAGGSHATRLVGSPTRRIAGGIR